MRRHSWLAHTPSGKSVRPSVRCDTWLSGRYGDRDRFRQRVGEVPGIDPAWPPGFALRGGCGASLVATGRSPLVGRGAVLSGEGVTSSRPLGRSGAAEHLLGARAIIGLLGCGIAYPVTYVVANDVIAAARYPGYSRTDQAVSELSAAGAPTRRFLVRMLPVFTGLTVAYGIGVWKAAGRRRALRATSLVLLASGATGIAWLPFPCRHETSLPAERRSAATPATWSLAA